MRKGLSIAAVILMSLALSACGSLGTKSNFEATLSGETDEYCSPFGDSGLETCIVSMNIKNITNSPQRITDSAPTTPIIMTPIRSRRLIIICRDARKINLRRLDLFNKKKILLMFPFFILNNLSHLSVSVC
jgi:hypothetical protein